MSTTTTVISSSQNKQDQKDEMEAVESYMCDEPRCFSYSDDDGTLYGFVNVTIPKADHPVTIIAHTLTKEERSTSVSYLPPVKLLFWLPSDYPSDSSPVYQLSAHWWTPQMERSVSERLKAVSEEFRGMPVLIACIEALKEEVLQCVAQSDFTINMDEVASRAEGGQGSGEGAGGGMHLMLQAVAHDERASAQQFEHECFQCPVCLDTKTGNECVRLTPCQHVFCKECLSTFYEQQLSDSAVKPLECLASECDSEPSPSLLRSLLPAEVVERYERIILDKALEGMDDTVHCPRPNCQAAVVVSPTEQASSTPSKLATCSVCNYSFCVHCGKAYHALEPCQTVDLKPSSSGEATQSAQEAWESRQKVLAAFERASDAEKEAMYRCMGGKRAVEDRMQQLMNERWMLQQEGRNCPWCNTYVMWDYGCYHMFCSACGNHFCWWCGEQLTGKRFMRHFGTSGYNCRGVRNQDQRGKPYLEPDDE